MKSKTSMEIQEKTYYSNENDDEYRNKQWVSVDDLTSEVIMNILTKVFEKAECCQEDTLWYDNNTTLYEMLVIQFQNIKKW